MPVLDVFMTITLNMTVFLAEVITFRQKKKSSYFSAGCRNAMCPVTREEGNCGLYITLVPKVLFISLPTLGTYIEF